MWSAIPLMFPGITILRCYFHWAQTVWRSVQELGLQDAYNSDDKIHKYICKLLSLPYLPAEHTTPSSQHFKRKQQLSPSKLINYINSTCMNSSVWPITSWSVFGCYTRTNNNVEGWHLRMNKAKRGQLSFYMLLCLFHYEAKTVNLQVHLVSENKLTHLEHKKSIAKHRLLSSISGMTTQIVRKQQISFSKLVQNMFNLQINWSFREKTSVKRESNPK